MTEARPDELYVGRRLPDGEDLTIDPADFTTHGVIVGMTGSGKTGLGVILLEEALLQDVPCLVIDPKGDMGNLLLTFPELRPEDFRPWIDEREAADAGVTADEFAAQRATRWREGLAGSGIGPERIGELRRRAEFTIHTPGSSAGVPMNLIGSLRAPGDATDAEALRDEVEGFTSSLLGLIDIDADPLASPEHILVSNLIERAWSDGTDLDLATLIGQIQSPPMRKLGVIDIDTFYPAKDRTALALKLNGLLASPSFAAWTQGPPLEIDALLGGDGRPKASIVAISHLSDAERMFVVTLLLSKVVTWMRGQPGTGELRALIYMDEVFGYVPPTAAPPAKKAILTILKQARAHGVGLVLSTQNPVDLDYKAISNAGTWMVGRLQTERDKGRLLEGVTSAGGGVDTRTIDDTISALDKREFLLHSTRADEPRRFATRWAMSYLAGPMTRDQIKRLTDERPAAAPAPSAPAASSPAPVSSADAGTGAAAAPAAAASPAPASDAALDAPATAGAPAAPVELADDETRVAPEVADGVEVRYADPTAAWAETVGVVAGGNRLEPALAARVHMLFDDTKADLRESVEWEAIVRVGDRDVDWADAIEVDYDQRDLRRQAPAGAVYALTDAPLQNKTFFRSATSALKTQLHRSESVSLRANRELKLYSRIDESEEDFATRCREAAEAGMDGEAEKIRDRLSKKMDTINRAIAKYEDRIEEMRSDVKNRRNQDLISIGASVLGTLMGGRASTSTIARSAGRAATRSSSSASRIKSIENRIEEKNLALEDLEEDLADALADIDAEWSERAEAIEPLEVGLEKNDIDVDEVVLVWLPVERG